ncbi:Poly [ADP-ribose] polymerase tankyrase, partial [Gryllus bimaculatus]
DARGETPLLAALQRGGGGAAMARVVALLAPRTDLARATAYGETALHLAARTDRPELHGAPTAARDLRGNTALHLAAGRGFVRVAALLLAVPGADANAANADGCTPLHVAVDSGFVAVVKLLLDIEQCDLHARTQLGQTPLDLAQEEYRRRSTPQMALILLQAMNRREEKSTS